MGIAKTFGAITPDKNMEDYLRMTASLPEREPETNYMGMQRNAAHTNAEPPPAVGDGGDPDPPEDKGG